MPVSKNLAALLMISSAAGCNDKKFTSSPRQESAVENLDLRMAVGCNDLTEPGTASQAIPAAGGQPLTLVGFKDHRIKTNGGDIGQLRLQINGAVCQGADRPRDIAFVVDRSGSMLTNDNNLAENGTRVWSEGQCGRKAALEVLLPQMSAPQNRFGLVTFSNDATQHSQGLVAGAEQIYGNAALAAVLCAAGGATNYEAALRSALQLLAAGRPEAQKEVYFITDGEPTVGHHQGITEELKRLPATLATVMVSGNDAVLKQMASLAPDGEPLHRKVESAPELAAALSQLVDNAFESIEYAVTPLGLDASSPQIAWSRIEGDADAPTVVINASLDLDPSKYPGGFNILIRTKAGNQAEAKVTRSTVSVHPPGNAT